MKIKRIITLGFSFLLAIFVALWIFRHSIAENLIDRGIDRVTAVAKRYRVELTDMSSGPLHIPTPFDLNTQHFRTDFDIGINNRDKIRSRFDASNVEVMLVQLFPPLARFNIEEFALEFHPDDLPDNFPFDRFKSGAFTSQALPVSSPKKSFTTAYQQLVDLFTKNRVDADFNFSGYVSVPVKDGTNVDVLLYTEKLADGKRRLRFKREDLDKVAEASDVRVSAAMLDILSEYPLRVPVIMFITHEAKAESVKMRQKNKNYPEDAHRHIVWSYMLTSEFGPEFAKEVTDSHETLDGNTPDERKMDYHNNAVARQLHAEGVKCAELHQIIFNDPRVIRHPREVASRKKLLK